MPSLQRHQDEDGAMAGDGRGTRLAHCLAVVSRADPLPSHNLPHLNQRTQNGFNHHAPLAAVRGTTFFVESIKYSSTCRPQT